MSCIYSTSLPGEIKARIGIEEVFNACFPGYPMRRRGDRSWMKCVFHNERTPSAFLDHIKNRYKCFGCSTLLDQIGLYAKANGIRDGEAIKQLASQLGIYRELTAQERSAFKAEKEKREKQAAEKRQSELVVRQAKLDCWETEGFLHTLVRHIYCERDLDRPGPVFALRNLSYIENLGDIFLIDNNQEKQKAAKAYRGWEECQRTYGLRL